MRTASRYLILAGAALALVGAAAAAPVLAHAWHGRGDGVSLLETYDTNGDGRLTQQEIDTARQQQLARFDRDGNGQLNIEEYQALWADAMRERMVRQFQGHDRDGDAAVTVEEFQGRLDDLVANLDENDDGALTADEFRRRDPHRRGERVRDGDARPERN